MPGYPHLFEPPPPPADRTTAQLTNAQLGLDPSATVEFTIADISRESAYTGHGHDTHPLLLPFMSLCRIIRRISSVDRLAAIDAEPKPFAESPYACVASAPPRCRGRRPRRARLREFRLRTAERVPPMPQHGSSTVTRSGMREEDADAVGAAAAVAVGGSVTEQHDVHPRRSRRFSGGCTRVVKQSRGACAFTALGLFLERLRQRLCRGRGSGVCRTCRGGGGISFWCRARKM